MDTKQIIAIRKDLNMRKGKIAAQASHASMSFLTKNMAILTDYDYDHMVGTKYGDVSFGPHALEIEHWLNHSFRKICVYVNSEQELDDLHQKALDAGLISHMIIDNGATEFNGVPTKTCLAIGPHDDTKFKGLTDHLPLL
jgi:PTH2 family peptidyl-tRNA hydrolase